MTQWVLFILAFASVTGGAFFLKERGVLFPTEERSSSKKGSAASPESFDVPLSIPGLLETRKGHIASRAAIVLNASSDAIIFEHDSVAQLPIASLTKIMSAMVALDHHVPLEKEVTILPREFTVGGNLRIVPGVEYVSIRDLLFASIVGSANNAALALARSTGLSEEAFVQEMNRKAVALGLEQLYFADPSGLDPKNVGSAYDVARLMKVALTEYPLIRDAVSRSEYALVTRNTHREHVVKNPNHLFANTEKGFEYSKTGYLDEALYCLTLARETPQGLLIAVTLGHPSEGGSEQETLRLLLEGFGRVAGTRTEP